MRLWHQELFENFACAKMVFEKYRLYFVDERLSKQLIKQYQESIPIWYLGNICFSFENAFQGHLLYYLGNTTYTEFNVLYHSYPNFIRWRMGWTVDQLSGHSGSWPFDFLVKLSLGLYRKYDYLNVLNVGLEPRTHVALHSDKLKEFYQQAREKRKAYKRNN